MNFKLTAWIVLVTGSAVTSAARADDLQLFDMTLEQLLSLKVQAASKYQQPVSEIPASATVMTRQEIERYGYVTLLDLMRNMPGVYIEEDTETAYFGTRGSIGGGVQFLVNGVPQHPSLQKGVTAVDFNRFNIPVESIDRIEFIRGPMSVIYGNNAFQGVVNIVTNDDEESGGLATAGVGSNDSGKVFVRVTEKSAGGVLVLNAGVQRSGGLTGDYPDMLSAGQLAALPSPLDHNSMDGDNRRDLGSVDISYKQQGFSADFRVSRMRYGIYPTLPPLRAGANDVELTTLQQALRFRAEPADNTVLTTSLMLSSETYQINALNFFSPLLKGTQEQSSQRAELEQTLAYKPHHDTDVLLGYRVQHIYGVRNLPDIYLQSGNVRTDLVTLRSTSDDYTIPEVFAQLSRRLTDSWQLTAGFRYSRLPEAYTQEWFDTATGQKSINRSPVPSRDELNYRVALLYDINDNHMLKFLYGTAAQDNESSELVELETVRTAEINYLVHDADWRINTSLYQSAIKNLTRRELRFDAGAGFLVSQNNNDGEWQTLGVEVEGEYRLSSSWRLGASLAWQETDDRRSDQETGYSPTWLGKFKTDYSWADSVYALYAYYVGERRTDWRLEDLDTDGVAETPVRAGEDVPGYWDLAVNWRWQPAADFSTNLNISNLLDEEYRYAANEVSDLEQGLIGLGRVITASVSYQF